MPPLKLVPCTVIISLPFLEALASLGMVMSVTQSVCLTVCLSVTLLFFGKEITVAPVFLVIQVRVKSEQSHSQSKVRVKLE